MPNIFYSLNLGIRSLSAQQTAVDICGHNIANINTPNYTRQRAILSPSAPNVFETLQIGTGVDVSRIQQLRDNYAVSKIKLHKSILAYATRKHSFLAEVEQSLASPNAQHLGEAMTELWEGFEKVGNNPESLAQRENLAQKAEALADSIRSQYEVFRSQQDEANAEVNDLVTQINSLAGQIAELNSQVTATEVGGLSNANDARDRRDRALEELAQLINITTIEDEAGSVTVFVGNNKVLVSHSTHNSLVVRRNTANYGYFDVYWSDGHSQRNVTDHITGGKLGADIQARDSLIPSFIQDLDTLAAGLIREVNRRHSLGYAQRSSTSARGGYAVYSSTLVLNDALNIGRPYLPYNSQAGSFKIAITKDGETVETIAVSVDPETQSLEDVVAAINSGTTHLTASVSQNRLQLTAAEGYRFVLGEDTGGVLAQLGLNVFFTGFDAATISVAQPVADDPTLIAAGSSFAVGDGANALWVSQLADAPALGEGTTTFSEHFNASVARAGNMTSAADFTVKQEQDSVDFYQNLRDQTSGVSEDEEMANLLMYQHAYRSIAHFVSVINSMIETVMKQLGGL